MNGTSTRNILVLGASGLIGRFVTDDLRERGFRVVGVARNLSASQKAGELDLELPVMSMDAASLARLLGDRAMLHNIHTGISTATAKPDRSHGETRAGRQRRLVFNIGQAVHARGP